MMTPIHRYHTMQPYIVYSVYLIDGLEITVVHPHSYQTWDCQPRYQPHYTVSLPPHLHFEVANGINCDELLRRIRQGWGDTPAV